VNHPNVGSQNWWRLGDAEPKVRRAITMLRNALYEAPQPPDMILGQVDALYHFFHHARAGDAVCYFMQNDYQSMFAPRLVVSKENPS
jgi:hypothetical protein